MRLFFHTRRKKHSKPTTEIGSRKCLGPARRQLRTSTPSSYGATLMLNNLKSGLALATAAAALFATTVATTAQAADDGAVKCAGINSCKGSSECKTAKNECKGHNSCKGQGWVTSKSAADCKKAGGKTVM
jgi:hypothetical protein